MGYIVESYNDISSNLTEDEFDWINDALENINNSTVLSTSDKNLLSESLGELFISNNTHINVSNTVNTQSGNREDPGNNGNPDDDCNCTLGISYACPDNWGGGACGPSPCIGDAYDNTYNGKCESNSEWYVGQEQDNNPEIDGVCYQCGLFSDTGGVCGGGIMFDYFQNNFPWDWPTPVDENGSFSNSPLYWEWGGYSISPVCMKIACIYSEELGNGNNNDCRSLDNLEITNPELYTIRTRTCSPGSNFDNDGWCVNYEIDCVKESYEYCGISPCNNPGSGDINDDGNVNVSDIVIMIQAILGSTSLTEEQLCQGDVDGNGLINVVDITRVVSMILQEDLCEDANCDDGQYCHPSTGICVEDAEIYGCIDVEACNYDELANTDNGTCEYPLDGYNCAGECVIGEDCNGECGGTSTEDECGVCNGDGPQDCGCSLTEGGEDNVYACDCSPYTDSDGDGWCDSEDDCVDEWYNCPGQCGGGCGNPCYEMIICGDNSTVCDESYCPEPVYGCIDAEACNYNELANMNNDTCEYPPGTTTCYEDIDGDGDYETSILIDLNCDETCVTEGYSTIETTSTGCTNPDACNFVPSADIDDGSCTYAEEYYDCDGNPINDLDGDGIPDELEIYGCTDSYAINYDNLATEDAGNCECDGNLIGTGDVTGSWAINVADVVTIVHYILSNDVNDITPCQFQYADISGDGELNIVDIVQMVEIILNGGEIEILGCMDDSNSNYDENANESCTDPSSQCGSDDCCIPCACTHITQDIIDNYIYFEYNIVDNFDPYNIISEINDASYDLLDGNIRFHTQSIYRHGIKIKVWEAELISDGVCLFGIDDISIDSYSIYITEEVNPIDISSLIEFNSIYDILEIYPINFSGFDYEPCGNGIDDGDADCIYISIEFNCIISNSELDDIQLLITNRNMTLISTGVDPTINSTCFNFEVDGNCNPITSPYCKTDCDGLCWTESLIPSDSNDTCNDGSVGDGSDGNPNLNCSEYNYDYDDCKTGVCNSSSANNYYCDHPIDDNECGQQDSLPDMYYSDECRCIYSCTDSQCGDGRVYKSGGCCESDDQYYCESECPTLTTSCYADLDGDGLASNQYPCDQICSDTEDCNGVSNSEYQSADCIYTSDGYTFDDNTIFGCNVEAACNYNPDASFLGDICNICSNNQLCQDDGTCVDIAYGCIDDLAYNYDSNANFDDGSCIYYGCVDASAYNYDETATDTCIDPLELCGSANCCDECIYPGCIDDLADNYDSNANFDDGSCIYYGCTDPNALNYDYLSNTDDDTCEYGFDDLNLVMVTGSYKISGDNINTHITSTDVISVIYQGIHYTSTASDIDSVDDYNPFSILVDMGELQSAFMSLQLRTVINDVYVILMFEQSISISNILDDIIELGDIEFVYDEYILLNNLGCTDPLSTNYDSCAHMDDIDDPCNILISGGDNGINGCNDPLACTCDIENCIPLCTHCGTEFEYVCYRDMGFYNPNSYGDFACTYPFYPVKLGLDKFVSIDYYCENDGYELKFNSWGVSDKVCPIDKKPKFKIYFDISNSISISKFQFRLNKIQIDENYKLQNINGSTLHLNIDNNNNTISPGPSVVDVTCEFEWNYDGGTFELELPIDDWVSMNIYLSDVIIFDNGNQVLEWEYSENHSNNSMVVNTDVANSADIDYELIYNSLNGNLYYSGDDDTGRPYNQLHKFHRGSNNTSISVTSSQSSIQMVNGTLNQPISYPWMQKISDGPSQVIPNWRSSNIMWPHAHDGDHRQHDNNTPPQGWATYGHQSNYDILAGYMYGGVGYNVEVCTNAFHPDTGEPQFSSYYCFTGDKCLDPMGNISRFYPIRHDNPSVYNDGILLYSPFCDSNDDNGINHCKSFFDDLSEEDPTSDLFSELPCTSDGTPCNEIAPSESKHSEFTCEESNAYCDEASNTCVGGYWAGETCIDVGELEWISKWCPGNLIDKFELEITGRLWQQEFAYIAPISMEIMDRDVTTGDIKYQIDENTTHYESFFIPDTNKALIGFRYQCKEFLYDSFNTIQSLSSLEGIEDSIGIWPIMPDGINIIQYETELITQVDTNNAGSYDTWLGTLTSLKVGNGYEIVLLHADGSTPNYSGEGVGGDYVNVIAYEAFYDVCGICSGGATQHIPNSTMDENSTCYNNICKGGLYGMHPDDIECDTDNIDMNDGCWGDCCYLPNMKKHWYSDTNSDGIVYQPGYGKLFNKSIEICDKYEEPIQMETCPDTNIDYKTHLAPDLCNDNCESDCIGVKYYHSNVDECDGYTDCLGMCHEGLQYSNPNEYTFAENYNNVARLDKYGMCCLQGNIDTCGICNNNGYPYSTTVGGYDVFNSCASCGGTTQSGIDVEILNHVQDDNSNSGEFDIHFASTVDLFSFKFKLPLKISNIVMTSITTYSSDFELLHHVDQYNESEIIIISTTSYAILPNLQIAVSYDDILIPDDWSYDDGVPPICIYNSTTEIQTYNDMIVGLSSEYVCADEGSALSYYGCSDQNALNYDLYCVELTDDCIEIECEYSGFDCGGTVPCYGQSCDYSTGNSWLNSCDVCMDYDDCPSPDTQFSGIECNLYGQDCDGVCMGGLVVDDCGVCGGENGNKDDCGVCDGDNSNKDCSGICFGEAVIDDCNVCRIGGESDTQYNSTLDCSGECGGGARVDSCEECYCLYHSEPEYSCDTYEENSSCSGCMDEVALNFDESATVPDGSCNYPEWVEFDPIPIDDGQYNMVGFTLQYEQSVNTSMIISFCEDISEYGECIPFENLSLQNGDKIQGPWCSEEMVDSGECTEDQLFDIRTLTFNNYWWDGEMFNLIPGRGYRFYSQSDGFIKWAVYEGQGTPGCMDPNAVINDEVIGHYNTNANMPSQCIYCNNPSVSEIPANGCATQLDIADYGEDYVSEYVSCINGLCVPLIPIVGCTENGSVNYNSNATVPCDSSNLDVYNGNTLVGTCTDTSDIIPLDSNCCCIDSEDVFDIEYCSTECVNNDCTEITESTPIPSIITVEVYINNSSPTTRRANPWWITNVNCVSEGMCTESQVIFENGWKPTEDDYYDNDSCTESSGYRCWDNNDTSPSYQVLDSHSIEMEPHGTYWFNVRDNRSGSLENGSYIKLYVNGEEIYSILGDSDSEWYLETFEFVVENFHVDTYIPYNLNYNPNIFEDMNDITSESIPEMYASYPTENCATTDIETFTPINTYLRSSLDLNFLRHIAYLNDIDFSVVGDLFPLFNLNVISNWVFNENGYKIKNLFIHNDVIYEATGKNITKIPYYIGTLYDMIKLEIINCNIDYIPESISNADRLESIKIIDSTIGTLNGHILPPNWNLSDINSLELVNIGLTEMIPNILNDDNNITSLNLSNNSITEISPDINKLRNLLTLNLSNNNISQLPSEFFEISKASDYLPDVCTEWDTSAFGHNGCNEQMGDGFDNWFCWQKRCVRGIQDIDLSGNTGLATNDLSGMENTLHYITKLDNIGYEFMPNLPIGLWTLSMSNNNLYSDMTFTQDNGFIGPITRDAPGEYPEGPLNYLAKINFSKNNFQYIPQQLFECEDCFYSVLDLSENPIQDNAYNDRFDELTFKWGSGSSNVYNVMSQLILNNCNLTSLPSTIEDLFDDNYNDFYLDIWRNSLYCDSGIPNWITQLYNNSYPGYPAFTSVFGYPGEGALPVEVPDEPNQCCILCDDEVTLVCDESDCT